MKATRGWKLVLGVAGRDWFERRTQPLLLPSPVPRPPSRFLQPKAFSLQPARGISLLEVLISMGVLVVGLLSVAAIIPAGRIEIGQGTKVDHAAMVGRAAFREIKVRHFLQPGDASDHSFWFEANNLNPNPFNPRSPANPTHAIWLSSAMAPLAPFNGMIFGGGPPGAQTDKVFVAIDPLGIAQGFGPKFPFGSPAGGTSLFMARIFCITNPLIDRYSFEHGSALADAIFRASNDLVYGANTARNFPPVQQMISGTAKRASLGDYSWLATVVSDPKKSAVQAKVSVAVVVFYKRDLSNMNSERILYLQPTASPGGYPGLGELIVINPGKPIQPGQWMMLAGFAGPPATLQNYYRWYRVISADTIQPGASGPVQNLTLAGPDWAVPAVQTQVWAIDNVVAVYERDMWLELP